MFYDILLKQLINNSIRIVSVIFDFSIVLRNESKNVFMELTYLFHKNTWIQIIAL